MSRLWQFCWLPTSSLCQERFKRGDVWERYVAGDGWIDEKLWSMRLRNSVVHKLVMLSRVSNSMKLGPKGRRPPYTRICDRTCASDDQSLRCTLTVILIGIRTKSSCLRSVTRTCCPPIAYSLTVLSPSVGLSRTIREPVVVFTLSVSLLTFR